MGLANDSVNIETLLVEKKRAQQYLFIFMSRLDEMGRSRRRTRLSRIISDSRLGV